MPRIEQRCPTCLQSGKPGWLWLSGDDWLKCPDCDGTTRMVIYEQAAKLPPTRVFLGFK